MRKFTALCVENELRLPMIYSDCSYNAACYQLEYEYDIEDASTKEIVINGKNYTYISAKLQSNKYIHFIYDERKGYLMLDDKEKYKNY